MQILGKYLNPVQTIILNRHSCRTFLRTTLDEKYRVRIQQLIEKPLTGIFGHSARFVFISQEKKSEKPVRLGTYGFISGAREFIVGIINSTEALLDFGYLFETLILHATDMGLATCWLGGFFHRSAFAKAVQLQPNEIIPAVSPIGYARFEQTIRDQLIRIVAHSDQRKNWQALFFDGDFSKPLTKEAAAAFAEPLEMVRWAPSASNKQPWRIVKQANSLHFFLQRTPNYRSIYACDLQMIDMGIALCHFVLTAKALSLPGEIVKAQLDILIPAGVEYLFSWQY